MSSDAPNWRQSIITRIIDRNKRESSYHRELIQQNNRFYDTVVQLEAENLRINVENEKLRTAVATGGKDSGGSFAVLERLLAEQKHLTELHKRKGDNSQMIVDLSMKVEEQRKLLSEKEQNCAEHMKMNQILRAESAMLRSSLEELKKLDTTLRDEHTALQLAFSALEEKMRGIQDENRSLLERLMKYKSKDADKLNEENENFLKKRSDKLRRDLEDAVRDTRNSISPNDLPPESASICGGDQVGGGGGGDFLYDEMLMLADEVNLSPGTGPERFHSSEPELIMKFEAHETEASAVRWNPVEKMVATGGADRRVKLWDVNKHITGTTTEARAVLGGSSAGINSVEFDSTGSYILGTSNDFGARLWTVADHRLRMSKVTGYFKIVQTVNNGKSELSVVPSAWEKNGILFWPTKSAGTAAMLSIKDPNSVPGETNWTKYKCTVKQPNVQWDFEAAEKEVTKMLAEHETSVSNSEGENINNLPPQRQKKHVTRRCSTSAVISNAEDVESPTTNNPQPAATPVIGESEKLTTHQQPIPLLEENKNSPNATAMTAPVANPTDGVDLCNIHSILKTLSENVFGLNTKFDHMNKKVDRLMELAEKQDSKVPPPALTSLKTIMDPIETFDDLYEFEAKLKTNKEFSNNLIEKLTHVCGANSMKGQNAAYTLVDIIFSRKLMTEFSWAGSCKKGGTPKRPFRQFEHVLKFFYTLVKKSDPTYTEVEARNFFKKKVLPNSLRRSLAPLIRASQPKTRRKGLKKRKPPKDTIPSQLSQNVKEEEEDGTESEDEEEEDEHDEDLFKEMLEEFVKEEEEVVQEEISEENADVAPPVKRMRRSTKGNGLNSEFLYTT